MSDEFQGDSGLKDDWDGTIIGARFEQQNRGNWALVLTSLADDGEEVEHWPLSVGGKDKGWVSYDGETIMGATEKQRYHEKSSVQQFINAAMAAVTEKEGENNELRRRSRELYNGRGPLHADLWVNLRFHWDVVTEMQGDASKNWEEDKAVQIMRPTRYLGVATVGGSAPRPTNTPPTSTSTTASAEITPDDLEALRTLAQTHADWGEFCDAVMDGNSTTGVSFTKIPEVRRSLSKKEWWEGLRSEA